MAFDSDQVGRAGVEFVMSDKYLDIAKGDADVALRSGARRRVPLSSKGYLRNCPTACQLAAPLRRRESITPRT